MPRIWSGWSPGPRVRICWRRMWRNCWRRPRRRRGFSVSVKSALGTVGLEGLSPQGHLLAVENLQDPGNLGAVLRTAEALGLSACCWRETAAMCIVRRCSAPVWGAVFRLPFRSVERLADAAPTLRQIGFALYAAVPDRTAKRVTELSFEKPSIIAVGNEGNGLEAETVAACGQAVTIPMRGRAESLNAAASAAILMWELMRD